MTKTHKAVLSTLAVLCLLFMGSGVAQAQECQAQATSMPGKVRAEGITEMVASIDLQCRPPGDDSESFFDQTIPETIDIAVVLNTNITNEIEDDREVILAEDDAMELAYSSGGIRLEGFDLDSSGMITTSDIASTMFAGDDGGKLSDDGDTITWSEIPKENLNLDPNENGFNLTIHGIRANASAVGHGEDIMATVMVNGRVVSMPLFKVADVATGLAVEVEAAEGLQCAAAEGDDAKTATITIQEGEDFPNAIMSGMAAEFSDDDPPVETTAATESKDRDSFMVTFSGIPEGVTVLVPAVVALAVVDDADTMEDESAPYFGLVLREGNRTDGVGKVKDGMAPVELSTASRTGDVIYSVMAGTTGDTKEEKADLKVVFEWAAGTETEISSGWVTVEFNPASDETEESFARGGAAVPRFVESSDSPAVVVIKDCTTTLLFPFVTNQHGFNTGLAITNASEEDGSCTIGYSSSDGSDAPDDMTPPGIAGGQQWVNLVSNIAPNFQGYVTASCEFRDAYGFAFITGPGNTLAQGYLAVCTSCD